MATGFHLQLPGSGTLFLSFKLTTKLETTISSCSVHVVYNTSYDLQGQVTGFARGIFWESESYNRWVIISIPFSFVIELPILISCAIRTLFWLATTFKWDTTVKWLLPLLWGINPSVLKSITVIDSWNIQRNNNLDKQDQ